MPMSNLFASCFGQQQLEGKYAAAALVKRGGDKKIEKPREKPAADLAAKHLAHVAAVDKESAVADLEALEKKHAEEEDIEALKESAVADLEALKRCILSWQKLAADLAAAQKLAADLTAAQKLAANLAATQKLAAEAEVDSRSSSRPEVGS
eukprot:gene10416-8365_t